MSKQHKIISVILALALGISVLGLSGCKESEKEPEPLQPLIYHSIPVKNNNEIARGSVADVAVRYFYLINNGEYTLANELIDRTDLSICTPEILEELYDNVLNFEFNTDNRVVAVNVVDNRARITFVNLTDTEKSWDPEYDEENPAPSWFGSTNPYVETPNYANTYEIEDVNQDGVIDETDMQWEDHPELNPDYEPGYDDDDEDDDYTTGTGARTVTYKTTASSARAENSNAKVEESSKKTEESNESSKVENSTGDKKDINDIGPVDITKDIKNESSTVDESKETHVKDVLPEDLFEEEEIVGYKTYTMDVYVTAYTSGFKVKLPSSMTTSTRLMIKVPYDMKIKVGDLELNKSMMNLNDFYVIDKLPKVSKFNVVLENLMLGHSEKEIDLTNRVYYIYSNLVPTRELKDQSLAYIKPALQQYYNDLLSGVKFENSMFLKEYLCKGFDLETVKYRYDKYQLERGMGVSTEDNDDKVITTYSIRKIRFPSSDAESGDEISPDKFRVTSYYYVEVPVYLTIDIQTIDSGSKQLETTEIGGIIKLTKDDDKLYVWELDEALALLD